MRSIIAFIGLLATVLMVPACAAAQAGPPAPPAPAPPAPVAPSAAPATAPAGAKLPHIRVDVKQRQVRVDAETLGVDAPLEFFCVKNGTNEHESVVRTPALPSHLHMALLMIGLKPGSPAHYSEAADAWLPPHGPPLQITMEYERDGKLVRVPAYRWMRDIRTGKPMPALTWIFSGSRVMEDGKYAADVTGYIVSIVNFDLTMIDIPNLASSANESLLWERDAEAMPPPGTKVTMVIEPAGAEDPLEPVGGPTTAPAGTPAEAPTTQALSNVAADEAMIARLRARWEKAVSPHGVALREAAQTHYEVINQLRREQLRLINEADKVQRLIDELEKEYQDLTTPRPEPVE